VLSDFSIDLIGIHGAMHKFTFFIPVVPEIIDWNHNVISAAVIGKRGFDAGAGGLERFDEYELMRM